MAVVTYVGNRPFAHYEGIKFSLNDPVIIEDEEMLKFFLNHKMYSVYGINEKEEEEGEEKLIEKNSNGSYRCKVCDSTYMSYQWAVRHIKQKHSESSESSESIQEE